MTDRSIIELLEKRDEEGLREAERLYGLGTEEISTKFGFSIAKVEKTLSRMQTALKKELKEKS